MYTFRLFWGAAEIKHRQAYGQTSLYVPLGGSVCANSLLLLDLLVTCGLVHDDGRVKAPTKHLLLLSNTAKRQATARIAHDTNVIGMERRIIPLVVGLVKPVYGEQNLEQEKKKNTSRIPDVAVIFQRGKRAYKTRLMAMANKTMDIMTKPAKEASRYCAGAENPCETKGGTFCASSESLPDPFC